MKVHSLSSLPMAYRMKSRHIWLRFPSVDADYAISRTTLSRLAARLGMSEVETVHYALKQLAKEKSPAYEPDDGPLTRRQIAAIRKRVPQGRVKSVKSTLF